MFKATRTHGSLEGKVIAITGAASGIAQATARECAAQGATLSLADITIGPLNELVTELKRKGANVIATQVDVSQSEAVDSWIAGTLDHFDRLDGAVNAAGIINKGSSGGVITGITETTNDGWDRIMGVNLTGLFYCLRAELRVMTKGASIVNLTSVAGMMGRPGLAAYSASKHGVIGLTKTAAKEVGEKGIRVNSVAPGPIDTPMIHNVLSDGGSKPEGENVINSYKNSIPLQRIGAATEVAKTICFLLSDASSFTTGVVLPADGGLTS